MDPDAALELTHVALPRGRRLTAGREMGWTRRLNRLGDRPNARLARPLLAANLIHADQSNDVRAIDVSFAPTSNAEGSGSTVAAR